MADTVKIKVPQGMSSVSVAGQEYPVEKGAIRVPPEVLPALAQAGIVAVDDEADPNLPAGITSDLKNQETEGEEKQQPADFVAEAQGQE